MIYEEAPTVTYVPQGRISQSPIDTKRGIVDTDGAVDPEITLKESRRWKETLSPERAFGKLGSSSRLQEKLWFLQHGWR